MYSLSQRPHMCGHCPGTLLYFLQNDRGQSRSHIHSSSAGQLSEKKTKMTVESYIYILLLSWILFHTFVPITLYLIIKKIIKQFLNSILLLRFFLNA